MKDYFIETHYKAKKWKYEKEYRFTKVQYPEELTKEDRTVEIPDVFFKEIILGINIEPDHEYEIIEIAKSKNIKVYKVITIPYMFELNRVNIT